MVCSVSTRLLDPLDPLDGPNGQTSRPATGSSQVCYGGLLPTEGILQDALGQWLGGLRAVDSSEKGKGEALLART